MKDFLYADVKQEILKLMLNKGSIPSLVLSGQQTFKTDLIQKLVESGYKNTDKLNGLKARAGTGK